MSRRIRRVILAAALVAAMLSVSQVLAKKPGGGNGCPQPAPGCICAQVYDPVTCNGGCTYSNACVAACAGATGCVPNGSGPVPL